MDTGHVPIKEKDRIQAEFKAAVNKIYDKLKVDSQEANQMNYRSRFENVKDQPDAGRIINRERTGLQSKIDSLKEEILLWENNIGFFAKSKQANLLKAEFEAKIDRAKEELASLEAKAKILRNVAREQQ
jgi:translation elongation factor EF-G